MVGSDVTAPSDREIEVLDLIGQGLTNREIAQALRVSSSTAKTHVHNLLRKLQLSSRVQLALYARAQNRLLAGPTGFEPAISSVTGWHVWPLHHGPAGVTVAEDSTGSGHLQMPGRALSSPTRRAPAMP